MVLVSPPERTGKDYDRHAPSTVYPSFAAERGIRRVDRAENAYQRADGVQVPREGGSVGRAGVGEAARVGGRTRICPRS